MPSRHEIIAALEPHIRFLNPDHEIDNLPAFCPFHKGGQESSPSLYVYVGPPKPPNTYPGHTFCHTCQEGWSLKALFKKLNTPYPFKKGAHQEPMPEERVKREKWKPDFTCPILPEQILGLYNYGPKDLLEAGFTKETLKQHDIGYDRRLRRIIFPIRDFRGNLVGISGRQPDGLNPRYKIYREELQEVIPGYELKKARVLWGLHTFYQDAMDCKVPGPVIVCEGFKATMWVRQCGYPHTVGLMGAAMSREQALLLSRVAPSIVLFLDNDRAGKQAVEKIVAERALGLVKIANYGTAAPISPDDLTKEQVATAVEKAMYLFSWRRKNDEWSRLEVLEEQQQGQARQSA